MDVAFQSVQVPVGEAGEGRLVLADGWLVAVLVRLGPGHGRDAGAWFMETGYGALNSPIHPTFATLEVAEDWIVARLTGSTVQVAGRRKKFAPLPTSIAG